MGLGRQRTRHLQPRGAGSHFKSQEPTRFSLPPLGPYHNSITSAFRGQGGISLLKQHTKEFLHLAEGPGCGSACARPLIGASPYRSAKGSCRFLQRHLFQQGAWLLLPVRVLPSFPLPHPPSSTTPPHLIAFWQCSGGELLQNPKDVPCSPAS